MASVSSFTSCKDYDDDINSLKESVAKAALQSNLDALTSQVATVKSTADQALTTANAAATKIDLDAVKSDLAAAKSEALAEAAKGIENAATAQEAADAAKTLAQKAKEAAENIDLSAYAKTADVDGKISAAAEAAKTQITTALADYVLASTLETRLAALKQEVFDANEAQMEEMKKKVDNAVEGVKAIWSALTSVSLYAYLDNDQDGTLEYDYYGVDAVSFDIKPTYGRVNQALLHYTAVKLNSLGTSPNTSSTAAIQTGSAERGVFGNKDYYAPNAIYNAKADRSVKFTHRDYIRPCDEILVRVSPANADLSAAKFKLVDTKGETADAVLEVAYAYPYTPNTALTRAGSVTGLWKVGIRLKDGVMTNNLTDVTVNATTTKAKLYSLAVNNTPDQDADRYLNTEYDLSFSTTTAYSPDWKLDGAALSHGSDWLDWTVVKNAVMGRTEAIAATATTPERCYNDYEWTAQNTNAVTKSTDRSSDATTYPSYPVNNGEVIHVWAGNAKQIRYIYVIRDDKNAGQSDASELNAWDDYNYEGLNVMTEGNVCDIKVTIPANKSKGDEIAFRLFAVNWDGSLCDPDGLPFTVFVGNDTNSSTVKATFHATKEFNLTKVFDITGDIGSAASSFVAGAQANLIDLKIGSTVINTVANITWMQADGVTNATNWSNTKKVKVEFGGNAGTLVPGTSNLDINSMANWPNGATATAKLALQSGTPATDDWYVNFELTKELPTAADLEGYWGWNTNQLKAGNVWKAVMYPESASNAADASSSTTVWNTAVASNAYGAYKGMNNAIWGLVEHNGTTYQYATSKDNDYQVNGNFRFTFANSSDNTYGSTINVDKTPTSVVINGDYVDGYILNLRENDLTNASYKHLKDLIDNTTSHASTVRYNFGRVSSEEYALNAANLNQYNGYILKLQDFTTIYACAFDEIELIANTYNAHKDADGNPIPQEWNYVSYETGVVGEGVIAGSGNPISITNQFNANDIKNQKMITVKSNLGAVFVTTSFQDFISKFVAIDAEFKSDGGNQEYFTVDKTELAGGNIKLIKLSTYQDPTSDVPSTLYIYGTDAFGHTHTFKMKFTVKTNA